MDYNFISMGDFRILEESGLLLESGTYDGTSGKDAPLNAAFTCTSGFIIIIELELDLHSREIFTVVVTQRPPQCECDKRGRSVLISGT